ncbi:biotin--[acetyl-CoA-carboxylase] ligase [Erythrobacter sp. SCSIO 43205]|nr:biotin--[acetyl-CoA-carboxylase] ligase [Erythrobacter sp. SCSIO 43205]
MEVVEETGSTNADLLQRLGSGEDLAEGYWLQAERQTGGRGRLGRKWESPKGNLFCSTLVSLRDGDPPAHTLSFVAGLAVADTLRRSLFANTPIMLKWPNDALVRGDKIAGILLERTGASVVVGIGVNVCYAPEVPGRQTTSILYENGKHGGNPGLVLSILADAFAARLMQWREQPLAQTLDDWTNVAHPIGSQLSVGPGDEAVTGVFAGLDEDGALLLRLANGALRTIHAGDVSMITQGNS